MRSIGTAVMLVGMAVLAGCQNSSGGVLSGPKPATLPFDCAAETKDAPDVAGQKAADLCPAVVSLYQLFSRYDKGSVAPSIEYIDNDKFYTDLAASLHSKRNDTPLERKVVVNVTPAHPLTANDLNSITIANDQQRLRMGLVLDAVKQKGGRVCLQTTQQTPLLVPWLVREGLTVILPKVIDFLKGDPTSDLKNYDAIVKAAPGGDVRSQPIDNIAFVARGTAPQDDKCDKLL